VYTFAWGDPDPEGKPAPDAPVVAGEWIPDAAAVAVKDGRVLAVGGRATVGAHRGAHTRVVDLGGAVLVPGLIESHGHYEELGELAEEVNLEDVASMDEIIQRVSDQAGSCDDGEWIIGYGWDEGEFADQLPTNGRLNELFPDTPVVLKGLRGFGIIGNAAALRAVGIDRHTTAPGGGEIVVDERGEPAGVLLNRATTLLRGAIPERTLAQRKRALLHGLNEVLRAGYVMGHHAGVSAEYQEAYLALAEDGALPMRVEMMPVTREAGRAALEEWIRQGPTSDPEAFLQVRSVKAYYDASLGSRGAKMMAGYSDAPDEFGEWGADYGFLEDLVARSMSAGFQAAIHAIGDGGSRDVLDFYQRTFARYPAAHSLRHRVEHAQVVHEADFARFAALDLVVAMQPPHAVEDSPWAEERVGPERIRGAYAWRTFRRHGVPLIFSADLMGSDFDLFYGLHCLVTRQTRDREPAGGWYPEQRLSPEEALRGYTVWPAYASSREALTGTIEPGKWADLTVLSIDPLNIGTSDPHALLDGRVQMTVVAGEIAFDGMLPD